MSLITLTYIFSVGATIIASQHNTNNSTIYNDYNGNITDANIAPGAAIEYTKLALTGTIRQTDLISTFNTSTGFGMVPTGGIIMWSGTIATIPTGWFLCNGSNSTPDLRNLFIVGADADVSSVAKSTITGAALQTSNGQLPALSVAIPGGQPSGGNPAFTYNPASAPGVTNGSLANQNISVTGAPATGGSVIVAKFYALAYIMKS